MPTAQRAAAGPAATPAPAALPAPSAPVAVRFVDARAPEHATHVELEGFEGPIALLLSLIEQRELDVLTVPLGELAGAYLDALATLDGERLSNVSAFVAVASQLILLKSRAMLPRPPAPPPPDDPDAPDPEEALRERLLLYRAYRDAGRILGERLQAGAASFHREASVAVASAAGGARAPREKPLDPRVLVRALSRSLALAAPPLPPPAVVPRTVTLSEQAAVVRAALAHAPVVVLQDLLHGVSDRVVLAVTFLAVLELSKRQELEVSQDEPWGPIVCRARGR